MAAPRYSRPIPASRLPGAGRYPDPESNALRQIRNLRAAVACYGIVALLLAPSIWRALSC